MAVMLSAGQQTIHFFGVVFKPKTTTRNQRLLETNALCNFPFSSRHYVMFVGNTGTGKTAVLMNKLRGLDPESVAACIINMNSFSDAPSLQLQMEQPLEKKSGVRYGPPGSRRWDGWVGKWAGLQAGGAQICSQEKADGRFANIRAINQLCGSLTWRGCARLPSHGQRPAWLPAWPNQRFLGAQSVVRTWQHPLWAGLILSTTLDKLLASPHPLVHVSCMSSGLCISSTTSTCLMLTSMTPSQPLSWHARWWTTGDGAFAFLHGCDVVMLVPLLICVLLLSEIIATTAVLKFCVCGLRQPPHSFGISVSLKCNFQPCFIRYDKQKILLKEIQNCQYAAAMNPTAGSFNITPRMQRHFVTFAVQVRCCLGGSWPTHCP